MFKFLISYSDENILQELFYYIIVNERLQLHGH